MDELEESIRRIVSESNVNVITKRMVRAEYKRQNNVAILSPQHKEAIDKVLDAIVQELCEQLKKGHSLESLKLFYNVHCPEAYKNNPKNTHTDLNYLITGTEVVKDKVLKIVVEDKDLNTFVKNKDLNTVFEDEDQNEETVKDNDLSTDVVRDNNLNSETVQDTNFNLEEPDCVSTQEHINETQPIVNLIVSSKINDSSCTLHPRNMKGHPFKRKRGKLFTADEVRDIVTLIDSVYHINQETNCSSTFSAPKGRTLDQSWEDDVALLPIDEPSPGHECKQTDPNSFEVSSSSSSQSSIADCAEVIVIDSSPERNLSNRTKSRSEDRNWLSLFSDEEVNAIMADYGLAYDRNSCDSACDTEPALFSRKRKSSPTKWKTSCIENNSDTLIASTLAKKKKTALDCSEHNVMDTLCGGNDPAFSKIKNTSRNKNFDFNLDRESQSQAHFKSRSCENLSVTLRLTPINADNIETIIDLTK